MIKINTVLFWCSHNKQNALSNKYEVTLGNLSKQAIEELTKAGITVKDRSDKGEGFVVSVKSNMPLPVYDADGNPLQEKSIGNGSKAVAIVSPYEWEFRNKKGISANLVRLIVTELVEYSSALNKVLDTSVPAL